MAQSRNNPVGERQKEREEKERKRERGSRGNSSSIIIVHGIAIFTTHVRRHKRQIDAPPRLPSVPPSLPDFITYLPRPFLSTVAALRSNETKSHKWPQCLLACNSPLAPSLPPAGLDALVPNVN